MVLSLKLIVKLQINERALQNKDSECAIPMIKLFNAILETDGVLVKENPPRYLIGLYFFLYKSSLAAQAHIRLAASCGTLHLLKCPHLRKAVDQYASKSLYLAIQV